MKLKNRVCLSGMKFGKLQINLENNISVYIKYKLNKKNY